MENRAAKIHNLDRISLLPEPILHHILCFLSQKTAIKTCVLSKAWRYLGCTRPKIEFDFGWRRTSNYSALVRILQGYHDRNLRLDEFSLSLSDYEVDNDDDATASLVNKWIPIIIQSMRVRKLDFYFDSGPELPSLIFESHHIQNLSLNGCDFESSSPNQVRRFDLKHLRILHLCDVYIPDEMLDNLLSSCPFIENVSLNGCYDFTTITLLSYKPTNLTHFCFDGYHNHRHQVSIEIGNGIQTLKSIQLKNCSLSVSHLEPLLPGSFQCNLTKLNLYGVYIPEQLLGDVLSNCTFISEFHLSYCEGFTRVALLMNNKLPTNVADFCFRRFEDGDVSIEIGNDMQTLRNIEIERCLFSVTCNKPLEYVSLTQLSLSRVKLMLSESFSCNLHCLEELKLDRCSGIQEFNLSSRSMKRLSIHNISKPFRVTVDAPSIVSFNYNGILPQSISFATTSSDDHLWKSKINLGSSDCYIYHCFNELYGLLKAVSQSEISLELDQIEIRWFQSELGIGDGCVSEEAKHELPLAVEHLRIKRYEKNGHSSADPFLNMLFHVFRPSFVYMGRDMLTYSNCQRSRVIAELLFKERGTTIHESYVWQHVLEGVGLQVTCRNGSEWEAVEYTSFFSFTKLCNKCAMGDLILRIHFKWRD